MPRRRTTGSTSRRHPTGSIYQVAADGTSKTLFDPDDKYIWALAVDRDGNIFAATGDKGVIYKITPTGQGTRFYKTSSTNVVSLAFTKAGDLIAGTESPGRVFRIDAGGKAFVLLESPYKEIHALRVADDGTIYAAAVSGTSGVTEDRSVDRPTLDPAGRTPPPTGSAEITSITVVDTPSPPSSALIGSPPRRTSSKGAIYRIRPNGLWDTYWETGDDSPYDVLIEPGGTLLVGTGPEGKIYRIARRSGARHAALARNGAADHGAPARAVGPRRSGRRAIPGSCSRCRRSRRPVARYESDVRDAGTVASWGVDPLARHRTPRAGAGRHAIRQHRHARRDLERVVEAVHDRRR